MKPTRRFRVGLTVLAGITAIGIAGYRVLEGLSFGDATYLTIVTLTTIGYGDVVPHTTGGRIFTMVLVLTGLGNVFYLASVGAEMVIEGHLRDLLGRNAMQRRINELRDHVIVCGYGRFGRAVASELHANRCDVVVIDADPAREDELRRTGIRYLIGSALDDDVLERAGLRHAKAIVIATPSEPDNVFITLSVREKSQTIGVHARGESDAGIRRLQLAGATQALSTYHSGGVRMAASILRPAVVDFLELSLPGHDRHVGLEEMRVAGGSRLVGRTVVEVEQEWPRVRIVGLQRASERLQFVPEPPTVLAGEDLLVVIGDEDRLRSLAQAASGSARV